MKRGPYSKSESTLINLYVPKVLLPCLDEAARRLDTDKSKFIRAAIREKMLRAGIKFSAAA